MAIKDWPGGVISKTPVVPAGTNANSAASGVWTLDQVAYWQKQGIWPNPANVVDPYFYDVSLLLTGDGTNGAQNNTFLDSSTNNFTITRNGNTTQGTFSPYGNLWSNYFDGSGDYLTVPAGTAFALGTAPFTIEFWANPSTISDNDGIFTFGGTSSGLHVCLNAGNWNMGSAGGYGSNMVTADLASWQHIAVVRQTDSGTIKFYKNGVYANEISGANLTDNALKIGYYYSTTYPYHGYLSNFRLVKGTALYTSNFTPSTTPLTAVSGTSLLTCQSNRFIDNSSNNFTLTVNGNTSVQRFSPFNPTAPYSAATIGGSGYFDGSGDYLDLVNTPALFGANNFTVECWFWLNSLIGYQPIICNQGAADQQGWIMYLESNNTINFIMSSGSSWAYLASSSVVPQINQWNHCVGVRTGGTLSLFLNGTRIATTTSIGSNTLPTVSGGLALGRYAYFPGGAKTINGYLGDVRLVNGTSVYDATQTTLTVPTAPLTAITNTSLLCNFTNAGIPDAAMMNDLETIGNAQVSTSVVKYGTGSLAFDGTGDYLSVPSSVNINYGSGSFTFEGWFYVSSYPAWGSIGTIISNRANVSSYGGNFILAVTNQTSSNKIKIWASSNGSSHDIFNEVDVATGLSTNSWFHLAIVRSGNTWYGFVNGTQTWTTTNSSSMYSNSLATTIGADTNGNGFTGYIDDLRITKGYARYTANFTPPTAAFPTF